jgi:hypothetical protein
VHPKGRAILAPGVHFRERERMKMPVLLAVHGAALFGILVKGVTHGMVHFEVS